MTPKRKGGPKSKLGSVSSHGRVRSFDGTLRSCRRHKGYTRIQFQCTSKGRKYTTVMLHRLVLVAFGPPPPGGKDCRDLVAHHKEGRLAGDHIKNLEWLSKADNTKKWKDSEGEEARLAREENFLMSVSKRVVYARKVGSEAERQQMTFPSMEALVKYLRDVQYHPKSRDQLRRYVSPSLPLLLSLSLSLTLPFPSSLSLSLSPLFVRVRPTTTNDTTATPTPHAHTRAFPPPSYTKGVESKFHDVKFEEDVDLPEEKWEKVPGTSLKASNKGRIWSAQSNTKTYGRLDINCPYLIHHKRFVHILVAAAWLGRVDDKNLIVHHKDGNKQNNVPSNLRIMTREDHCAEHAGNDKGALVAAAEAEAPEQQQELDYEEEWEDINRDMVRKSIYRGQ